MKYAKSKKKLFFDGHSCIYIYIYVTNLNVKSPVIYMYVLFE